MRRRRGEASLFEILSHRTEDPLRPGRPSPAARTDNSTTHENAPPVAPDPRSGRDVPEAGDSGVTPSGVTPSPGSRLRGYGVESAFRRGGVGAEPEAPAEPGARTDETGVSGIWTWLNRTVEVRFATISVYGVGVILALYLVFLTGRSLPNALDQELQDLAAPYKPGLTPPPNWKAPFRHVVSETGGPEAANNPSGEAGPAPTETASPGAEPAQHDPKGVRGTSEPDLERDGAASPPPALWGVVVHQGTDVEGADSLLTALGSYEKKLGVDADIQTIVARGRKNFLVYFGPFTTEREARDRLPDIQRLTSVLGTNFKAAYVRSVKDSRRPN